MALHINSKIKIQLHVQKDQKDLRVDPHRVANCFNDYFTSFAKNLFSKITTKHNFRQFV